MEVLLKTLVNYYDMTMDIVINDLRPVFIVLFINLILSVAFKLREWTMNIVLASLTIPFPFLIVIIGALFSVPPNYQNLYPNLIGKGLFFLTIAIQILFSVFVVVINKKSRWLATSLSVFSLYLTLCASFITLMAITGEWL